MAYYKNAEILLRADELYSHNCIDGKCSGCGECCADLLPLSDDEIKRLKVYVAKHNIKEHRHTYFFDPEATDLTCPFRNEQEMKCEVYPVRPLICRSFICSKSIEQARHDRDHFHETRSVHSLRYEIFGNNESLNFLTRAVLAARES